MTIPIFPVTASNFGERRRAEAWRVKDYQKRYAAWQGTRYCLTAGGVQAGGA